MEIQPISGVIRIFRMPRICLESFREEVIVNVTVGMLGVEFVDELVVEATRL